MLGAAVSMSALLASIPFTWAALCTYFNSKWSKERGDCLDFPLVGSAASRFIYCFARYTLCNSCKTSCSVFCMPLFAIVHIINACFPHEVVGIAGCIEGLHCDFSSCVASLKGKPSWICLCPSVASTPGRGACCNHQTVFGKCASQYVHP